MIRWRLESIGHGPLVRARIFAGRVCVGMAIVTQAECAELASRLGEPVPVTCARCGKPVPAGQATHASCAPIVVSMPSSADLGQLTPRKDVALIDRCLNCGQVVTYAGSGWAHANGLFLCGGPEPGETEGPDIVAVDGSVQ